MRIRRSGDRAVVVDLDSLEQVHSLHSAVRRAGIGSDSVPGWRSLLVATSGETAALVADLEALAWDCSPASSDTILHEIPVTYDGEDLEEVAARCRVAVAEVIDLHSSAEYLVAFLGFSGGFAYLAGLPDKLHLPRRDIPRTRVPAGSVAIALDQCGIYPAASPGGWHLIGRTDWCVFDPQLDPPSRLSPGDRVRFINRQGGR
ncbi:MAG: 5-oxoprolinase subunit PxpB [Candidatus Dormibacteria bacterium]